MAKKRTYNAFTFQVVGNLSFPLDMLRYDRCVLDGQEDVSKATERSADARTVRLVAYSPAGNRLEPTTARWASFGWHVVTGSVKVLVN